MDANLSQRLEMALKQADPVDAALALARTLRDEGVRQADLYLLYSQRFEIADPTDRSYDALQESLDLIVGGPWAKGHELYPGPEYQPPFTTSDGEVRAWVDGGIHLQATTPHGDPVELSEREALALVAALSGMLRRLR